MLGCHSSAVETISALFCNAQLARHRGFSVDRPEKTRETARRMRASYPGTGLCSPASVFPRRFSGSKEKHTTPARNACRVCVSFSSSSSSNDPNDSSTASHASSRVSSFTKHKSSCTSFAHVLSASTPLIFPNGPVAQPSRSGKKTPPRSSSRTYRSGYRAVSQSHINGSNASAAGEAVSSHTTHGLSWLLFSGFSFPSINAWRRRISRAQRVSRSRSSSPTRSVSSSGKKSCSNQSLRWSRGAKPVPAVTPREAQRNRPEVAAPAEANRSSGNGERRPSRGVEAAGDGDEDDVPKTSSFVVPDRSLVDMARAVVERRAARTRRERRGA